MKNKWVLALMILSMLALPMLACGFPLPAGTTTALPKAICAASESAESCQVRQDAYEMMNTLQSARVENLVLNLNVDDGEAPMQVTLTGWYEYAVAADLPGGAYVHGMFDSAEMNEAGAIETFSGLEFVIAGNQGFTKEQDGEWTSEMLEGDAATGMAMILGLGGAEANTLNFYSDSAVFAVTSLEGPSINGQSTISQTLSMDLASLFGSASALGSLMNSGFGAGGDALGMSQEDLGVAPEELAMMSFMLLPALDGTQFNTTVYIGAEDGYIHRIEDDYAFIMDLAAIGMASPDEPSRMEMIYQISGDITGHNQPVDRFIPEGAIEGSGGLFGEGGGLFGGGLGDSLLGG